MKEEPPPFTAGQVMKAIPFLSKEAGLELLVIIQRQRIEELEAKNAVSD